MSYKEEIDLNRIPQHVAIIMDGNGRWAKQRGHERSYGHQAGVREIPSTFATCDTDIIIGSSSKLL